MDCDKVSPLPWTFSEDRGAVLDANCRIVCDCETYYPVPVSPGDQRFIATASHAMMLCAELLDNEAFCAACPAGVMTALKSICEHQPRDTEGETPSPANP